MADRVKAASGTQKKTTATEETGQKAAELLPAVLEELKASRAESEALRKLLAQVLTALTKTEEAEESFAQEASEGEAGQEGSARPTVFRQAHRVPGPVAIQFVDPVRKVSQEGKKAQE